MNPPDVLHVTRAFTIVDCSFLSGSFVHVETALSPHCRVPPSFIHRTTTGQRTNERTDGRRPKCQRMAYKWASFVSVSSSSSFRHHLVSLYVSFSLSLSLFINYSSFSAKRVVCWFKLNDRPHVLTCCDAFCWGAPQPNQQPRDIYSHIHTYSLMLNVPVLASSLYEEEEEEAEDLNENSLQLSPRCWNNLKHATWPLTGGHCSVGDLGFMFLFNQLTSTHTHIYPLLDPCTQHAWLPGCCILPSDLISFLQL